MTRTRAFLTGRWLALVACGLTLLTAAVIAGAGVAGLAGWVDRYSYSVPVLPGTDLVTVSFQPSWDSGSVTEVCREIRLRPHPSCAGLLLSDTEPTSTDGVIAQGDLRPVRAVLRGPLLLDPEPGWNPLVASLYGMRVLALLVLAFLLLQLAGLLGDAASGDPFTGRAVRRLRLLGGTLIAWEVAEPLLWLVLSPKAWDYFEAVYGPGPTLSLGSMQPGGPSLTVLAFGALLLLLGEVFRHGAALSDDEKLTV